MKGQSIRCQCGVSGRAPCNLKMPKDGYDLPQNKYDHWRNIEIQFDPTALHQRK